MISSLRTGIALITVLMTLLLLSLPVSASRSAASRDARAVDDPGLAAAGVASKEGRYLMVLFRQDDKPSELAEAFNKARGALADTAKAIVVNTLNPAESGLVKKYNLYGAPMPLAVIIAPNGAVTGTFKKPFTVDQARQRFMGPVAQACILAFQQRKIVFLCVQGETTKNNGEAMAGVNQFKKDPKLGSTAEVVIVDPGDPEEKPLLRRLGVTLNPVVAETILLAPPGKMLGKWSGATSKDVFTKRLIAEASAKKTCRIPNCGDPNCETKRPEAKKGGK